MCGRPGRGHVPKERTKSLSESLESPKGNRTTSGNCRNSEEHRCFRLGQVAPGSDFRSVSEDSETVAELMLHAEQFCSRVEEATKDVAPIAENSELRIKIGQIRNQLAELQEIFNDGKLSIENPRVRADFRQMVIALLWVAFYARSAIDFKTFRMLVRIEVRLYISFSESRRLSGATLP